MHGLEAVARVRQGARNDHAHGVVEIRAFQLVFDSDRGDAPPPILGPVRARYAAVVAQWNPGVLLELGGEESQGNPDPSC